MNTYSTSPDLINKALMEDTLLLMDKNGIIQNRNRGAEKIKGYKEEEVTDQHHLLCNGGLFQHESSIVA